MKKYSVIVPLIILLVTAVASASEPTRVLFDQGHNQRFRIEDKGELQLSSLADVFRSTGASVDSTSTILNENMLKGVTALVISGPFDSLQPEEAAAVAAFVENGGSLAVMIHIGQPLAGLLAKLDVDFSNAVLHERLDIIDNDLNFRVTALSASPLFSGISRFSVYGAWALNPGASSTGIAQTSQEAWVDLDGDRKLSDGDAAGPFSIVASGTLGAGRFVIFGDDAMFQNRYLDADNTRLAANLVIWLTGREKAQ